MGDYWLVGLLTIGGVLLCQGVPFSNEQPIDLKDQDVQKGVDYLQMYDYLPPIGGFGTITKKTFKKSLKQMQNFSGLKVTGKLDNNTLTLMAKPRCGVPDPIKVAANGQVKRSGGKLSVRVVRAAFTGGKWQNNKITYRIINTTPDLPIQHTENAIERAFQVWSDVTPLVFTRTSTGSADINLRFDAGAIHGDGYRFDGPGGMFGHAFPPENAVNAMDGDVHFDDDEKFTFQTMDGLNLFQVAAHLIGHSLGLAHSSDTEALMSPFYHEFIPQFQLPDDDRDGIQRLYGNKPVEDIGNSPARTGEDDESEVSRPCNKVYDAVAFLRGDIFMFKDNRYWRLYFIGVSTSDINHGDPVDRFWEGLPDNIDATYERPDTTILFFKGSKYWEYRDNRPRPGFPKPISHLSPKLPRKVDATLTWPDVGKTYFFFKNQVWRFDEKRMDVDRGYPKLIKDSWAGVPDNIDGAFSYRNGCTYFVKGKKYYRYNNRRQFVEKGFPRSFGVDFLMCRAVDDFTSPGSITVIHISDKNAQSQNWGFTAVEVEHWEGMERQASRLILGFLLISLLAAGCQAGDDDDLEYLEVQQFLQHYGYLRPLADITQHYDDDELEEALRSMQALANLNISGTADGNTLAKMRMPRCGNPDVDGVESLRKRRYNLAGPRWNKRSLTYRITGYTRDFSRSLVDQEIDRAFKVWSDVTNLNFRKVAAGNCDIIVLFAKEEHGDGHSFDGRGGTLAHAYFPGPGIGGDAHFDDDEQFTTKRSSGTNLFLVAAHEFGHSLGLGHSGEGGSLMAPYYQGYKPNFRLPSDDIQGIQELYGRRKTPNVPQSPSNPDLPPLAPPERPGTPANPPNACLQRFQGGSIIRGEIFLFQNEIYWRLKKPGVVVPNHPMNAENLWYGFQSDIDAVYERQDGTIIFTKGPEYWEYNGVVPKPGFPKTLASIGLPQDIDAAFVFPSNGKTYVFRGSRYWRYDEKKKSVDNGYPKNIRKHWKGVPSSVDAAFPYQGFTYFIRGQEYWKFNNVDLQVERGYPKNFPREFLGCNTVRRYIDPESAFTSSAVSHTAGLLSFISLALLYLS